MKDIIKLLVALTLIAGISGLILSVVESSTREPIQAQRKAQMVKALSAVLPAFDNSPDTDTVNLENGVDKKGNPLEITFYRARQGDQLVGTAFKMIAPEGYSGNIEIMIGLTTDESVSGIEILNHAETPGLGAKITEGWFKEQYKGKSLENADWRVKKDGGEFDQISGATISPRAVTKALKAGLDFYHEHKTEITEGGAQ